MDSKQLKERFDNLYSYAVSSKGSANMRALGDMTCKMMHEVIDAHPQMAEEYINMLEAVKWDNYLTEKEADNIVASMNPQPRWSHQQWQKMMEQTGEPMEVEPMYNRCALYVTMCMVDSDNGTTIGRLMGKEGIATNDMDYFGVVHQFALDKLKDKDGVFDIRHYFADML